MDASPLIFVVTVGITGLGAIMLARSVGERWPAAGPGWIFVEAIGLGVLFLAANVGVATVGVLVGRAVRQGYVPIYAVDDSALLAVSLLQGVWFRLGRLGPRGFDP